MRACITGLVFVRALMGPAGHIELLLQELVRAFSVALAVLSPQSGESAP